MVGSRSAGACQVHLCKHAAHEETTDEIAAREEDEDHAPKIRLHQALAELVEVL